MELEQELQQEQQLLLALATRTTLTMAPMDSTALPPVACRAAAGATASRRARQMPMPCHG